MQWSGPPSVYTKRTGGTQEYSCLILDTNSAACHSRDDGSMEPSLRLTLTWPWYQESDISSGISMKKVTDSTRLNWVKSWSATRKSWLCATMTLFPFPLQQLDIQAHLQELDVYHPNRQIYYGPSVSQPSLTGSGKVLLHSGSLHVIFSVVEFEP